MPPKPTAVNTQIFLARIHGKILRNLCVALHFTKPDTIASFIRLLVVYNDDY